MASTVLLAVLFPLLVAAILVTALCYCRAAHVSKRGRRKGLARGNAGFGRSDGFGEDGDAGSGLEDGELEEEEDLFLFPGGEELTIHGILDAPGEVVGKSGYGTLYKASLQVKDGKKANAAGGGTGGGAGSLMLLRFVRPVCMGRARVIFPTVQVLGFLRHPNLVPLRALYVGPRGEKLFVHPFYSGGSLWQFLRDKDADSYNWESIHKLSLGIARGLDHLHNALQKPIIHGNLKSKNILFETDLQPRLSDYGLHLLLNPTSAQEMLEASASQGYKAPELIKMKEASTDSDIYSLGVVFLEMLTRKEPKTSNLLSSWELHLPTSIRNMLLEHKVSEIFCPELRSQCKDKNAAIEQQLLGYFQLAMSCCSPSPTLRPDIKFILRKLEEIRY